MKTPIKNHRSKIIFSPSKFKTMIDFKAFNPASSKWYDERLIEVDGNKVPIRVTLTFNHIDGTGRVEGRLSSKTISRSAVQNAAVDDMKHKMEAEGREVLLALEYDWKVSNGEINPNQTDLFSTPKERYEKSADQAMQDEHGVKWNEDTERYEDAQGNAWNANDGGPDDEDEPGEKELSLTAPPPKEARTRKPRSNPAPAEV